jgi:hypothetical protein
MAAQAALVGALSVGDEKGKSTSRGVWSNGGRREGGAVERCMGPRPVCCGWRRAASRCAPLGVTLACMACGRAVKMEAAKWANGTTQYFPRIFERNGFDSNKKMVSRAQQFPNKICTCKELNREHPYWYISKFGMEFELKIREPI